MNQSVALQATAAESRLRGRWLAIARGIWVTLALALLANFIASVPAYYQALRTICPPSDQATCLTWQPTPANVAALGHLGISVDAYAAYFISVDVAVSLVFWFVGLLIFWRKSDEWLGLFVSFVLLFFGSAGISDTLSADWTPNTNPSSLFLLALSQLPTLLQWAALGFFLVTFPTGRFAPRWTWMVAFLWIVQFLAFDIPSEFLGIGAWPGTPPIFLLTWGSTAFVLVYRYRRVFTPAERQQTKWVIFGVAIGVLIEALSFLITLVIPELGAPDAPYQLLSGSFTALLFLPIPLSIGVAILRYRLWDIDTIINRALVYASLTALLGALYAGLIIGLVSLASAITGTTADEPVALVIATLAIAALFQPVRSRIQAIIDRRFYRRKYDAEKMLAAFSAMLRGAVDLEELREQVLAVVKETMQPAHVSLWLRSPKPHTAEVHLAVPSANLPPDDRSFPAEKETNP
ncbi:MAG TPA: hypothetical protein VKT82_23030 [Ktedonobacterales bacterium]|nr:hypothetical protein [Ktedonobacterales bacterium]